MLVREKGYQNWEGQLQTNTVRWAPIFKYGVKHALKKRMPMFFLIATGIVFLFFLMALYVATKPELSIFKEMIAEIKTDAALFNTYYSNGFIRFFMVMMAMVIETFQISSDLKHKSFSLYLSRPISRMDYVFGKYALVLFFLLLMTLVPGLILLLFKIIFTGSITISLRVFGAAVLYPIVIAFFWSSLIIMFSTFSTNGRFVKAIFFGFYIFLNILSEMLFGIFRMDAFLYINLETNITTFSSYIFGVPVAHVHGNGLISGGILIAMTVICMFIALSRIKRAEV